MLSDGRPRIVTLPSSRTHSHCCYTSPLVTWFPAHLWVKKFNGKVCSVYTCGPKNSLTSDVREVLSSFPAVWASIRVFLVFIQAGFAVDPPTASYLVGGARYKKADLTHQFVWWCVHKLAVISTSVESVGSHLFATHAEAKWYISHQYTTLRSTIINSPVHMRAQWQTLFWNSTVVSTVNLHAVFVLSSRGKMFARATRPRKKKSTPAIKIPSV